MLESEQEGKPGFKPEQLVSPDIPVILSTLVHIQHPLLSSETPFLVEKESPSRQINLG